jgi:hypothetical protein
MNGRFGSPRDRRPPSNPPMPTWPAPVPFVQSIVFVARGHYDRDEATMTVTRRTTRRVRWRRTCAVTLRGSTVMRTKTGWQKSRIRRLGWGWRPDACRDHILFDPWAAEVVQQDRVLRERYRLLPAVFRWVPSTEPVPADCRVSVGRYRQRSTHGLDAGNMLG